MIQELPVISVVGDSDSGKTELICQLIEELRGSGYDVATIKHTRGDFSIDTEDKDTWKHSKAGAELVVFSSPEESDFLYQRSLELEELVSHIEEFGDHDLVLVEGMKEEDIPKISVGEGFEDESGMHYSGDMETILDYIERKIELHNILIELAGQDCGECGYPSCEELAESILEGENSIDDCQKLENTETVKLWINGESVSLGRFPANMVEKTIRGMLSSLKGIEGDENDIEIEIDER
ncbi:MAG: molybdopterin-guanine dinucleotide biosynthesis protein B [Thermoplasmata archaeon]